MIRAGSSPPAQGSTWAFAAPAVIASTRTSPHVSKRDGITRTVAALFRKGVTAIAASHTPGTAMATQALDSWPRFQVTQAGEFQYYCSIPGHRQVGMFGTLKVSGESLPAATASR